MPMSNESEENPQPAAAKRPKSKFTLTGIAGAVVLGFVGAGLLGTIAVAILFGEFVSLAVSLGAVGLVWLLTKPVRPAWLAILLRALAVALLVWPFIPHPSVEWGLPWPNAGYWVWLALQDGRLHDRYFELTSMVIGAGIMWLAGLAVHRDRHRQNAA